MVLIDVSDIFKSILYLLKISKLFRKSLFTVDYRMDKL